MSSSYDSLSRQRDNKYDEKRSCECRIKNIEEDLRRLRAAKNVVSDVKGDVSALANKTRSGFNDLANWKGIEYSWAKGYGTDQIYNDTIKYRNDADRVLDRICDEITRLENERHKNEGLLGSIVNAINDLGNAIEKLFN